MTKQFAWEKGKQENQIIIKQKQADGKFRKILELNMDNIPEFSEIWTEIKDTVKIALDAKIDDYTDMIRKMFPVVPAELGKTDINIDKKIDNALQQLNERQKIKDPKLIESKGDVECAACTKPIMEKTEFFLCPVCGKPTHLYCGTDGVCNPCLEKA